VPILLASPHRTEPNGLWSRPAIRSQISLELYRCVQHSTIPVSPSGRIPCSIGLAVLPRIVANRTEYGRARRIKAKSDWNCKDTYCTVPLGTVRYRYGCPAVHSASPYAPGGPSLASVAPYYIELLFAVSPPSRTPHWRLLTALAVTGFAECSYQIPHWHLKISHA